MLKRVGQIRDRVHTAKVATCVYSPAQHHGNTFYELFDLSLQRLKRTNG